MHNFGVLPEQTKILVIRHGQTQWNVDAKLQGQTDVALNAHGLWQAQRMADALKNSAIEQIYSSDLQRAHQTAKALGAPMNKKPVLLPQWRERCFGEFEGKAAKDLQTRALEAGTVRANIVNARAVDFAPVGGESLRQLQTRILKALDALVRDNIGKTIALVTHGGVIDVLYRHAQSIPLAEPRKEKIENTSISQFIASGASLELISLADSSHLQAQ